MRKLVRNIFLITLIGSLFVACSDKKDANKSNFKEAINNHLDSKCISFGGSYNFPVEIELKGYNKDELDSLEKVGLLKSVEKKLELKAMFGNPTKIVDGLEYSLTDLGKTAFSSKVRAYVGEQSQLCAGKYKVTEIINFTEPADMMGVKLVRVTYKKVAVDVPTWAYELVKEKNFEYASKIISKEAQDDKTELVLTNEGWILAKDFK